MLSFCDALRKPPRAWATSSPQALLCRGKAGMPQQLCMWAAAAAAAGDEDGGEAAEEEHMLLAGLT